MKVMARPWPLHGSNRRTNSEPRARLETDTLLLDRVPEEGVLQVVIAVEEFERLLFGCRPYSVACGRPAVLA